MGVRGARPLLPDVSRKKIMAIQSRDLKLLWGKAASRCSMPDCRIPLVVPECKNAEDPNVIFGEMAHIVGETKSKKSPRGNSHLDADKRNLYTNLILLCPNHHTLIDKNVADWPVELLHVIKRDHEIWVETQLGKTIDEQLHVYHDFIDRASLAFHLENWEWLCDNLFRQIMPVDFRDGVYQLGFEHFRAIMPGKDIEFEKALDNLITRSKHYLVHYLSNADVSPENSRIVGRKRYRDIPEDDFEQKQKLLNEYNIWERNCTMLLFNFVRALNEFADATRKSLRPRFFVRKGKFCVHDFMGLMGGTLTETWHLPEHYFTKVELDAPMKMDG